MNKLESNYDVALSFAGEDRAFVRQVVDNLKRAQIKVFYYEDEEVGLWGKNLGETLDEVYRLRSRYVVIFISEHYAQSMWTEYERKCALDRAIREKREYVLPARFDDTKLPGIWDNVAYVDLRKETPEAFASKIVEKITSSSAISTIEMCDDSQSPRLPDAYLPRNSYLTTLGSVMWPEDFNRPRLRVIRGPSGVGKSALASEFFRTAKNGFKHDEARWIDCRVNFEMPSDLKRCRLIVFDNVDDNHPLIEKRWLMEISDAIIVLTTTSQRVETKIRSQMSVLDYDPTLITMGAFTESEIEEFLKKTVPQKCILRAIERCHDTGGFPVALQLLRELCLLKQDTADKLYLEEDGGLKSLLDEWLLVCDETGAIAMVVESLATVPFVGMDREALVKITDRPSKDIDEAIERMKRIGLVTEICAPGVELVETIAILHEAVRELYNCEELNDMPKWRHKYLSLLEDRLSLSRAGHYGVLTCVDAWIIGWKEVFDLSGDQQEKYLKHVDLLKRLIANESETWMAAINSIPQFLSGRIQDPGRESCAIVIGIAHMVSELKPNRALATTIWLGCRNPNLWARSASIAAATRQWDKLGPLYKREGTKELHKWLLYAYQMGASEREALVSDSYWDDPIDTDFLAAVCGLVKLTNINEALQAIETRNFSDRFPRPTLSHLALLVKLADDGVFENRGDFRLRANSWMERILDAPWAIQVTAWRVGKYIHEVSGFQIDSLTSLADPGGQTTYVLDVAKLCDSERLKEFACKAEKELCYHI